MKTEPTPMRPRQLVAAFKFNEKTFVWRCDRCAKMFYLEVDEALPDGTPRLTLLEFERHLCAFASAAGNGDSDDHFEKIVMFRQDDNAPGGGLDRG